MDGVSLCARFSLATSRLAYCGPKGADATLYRAATRGEGTDAARAALLRFEALAPYLELIAERTGRDPLDAEVVEAYWIGNALLDRFGRPEFVDLLDRLVRRGLPRPLADRLAAHLPRAPIPHHAFHVLFVGVGNVTGHVPTTVANMEACRPSWGQVVDTAPGELTVRGPGLAPRDGRLGLVGERERRLPHDPALVGAVRPGDWVAHHWGLPGLVLSEPRRTALERYTERSIAAANEAFATLGTLREG
ncbi:MAG TPA: DUF6390 family protein [Thermoplasmata archaeon]|nr:DUF6390 family protein [Thermoplasmata archaeon]